jgi:hypothetical protein
VALRGVPVRRARAPARGAALHSCAGAGGCVPVSRRVPEVATGWVRGRAPRAAHARRGAGEAETVALPNLTNLSSYYDAKLPPKAKFADHNVIVPYRVAPTSSPRSRARYNEGKGKSHENFLELIIVYFI